MSFIGKKLLFFVLLLSCNFLIGQEVYQQYLIEVNPNENSFKDNQLKYKLIPVNSNHNLYKINFYSDLTGEEIDYVLKVELNAKNIRKSIKADLRSCSPNDEKFGDQYNLMKMRFDELWCLNNSGLTPSGDTIVIGIIDKGFNYSLPDIFPNIYKNYKEIPDNLIDDDGNGYIDDYYGFNGIQSQGDNHPLIDHGTQVSSVLGAKGNNRLLMSGAAQNIKMLICSANSNVDMINCYEYFYNMKKKYNDSNGSEGAFVVCSTTSLGFANQFPKDQPELCEVFEKLNSVGISSTAATVNENINVDIEGDLPGLCPSVSIIGVTNTTRNDAKVISAGYGKVNVDIAATGENIPSISASGEYKKDISGTSFSTPQVAAAIGLMYQFCNSLTVLSKTKPDSAILYINDVLLNSGPELIGLKNSTKSGRRLDAYEMAINLSRKCNQVISDTSKSGILLRSTPVQTTLKFDFTKGNETSYFMEIFDLLGQLVYCKKYEFNTKVNPIDLDIEGWSAASYYLRISGGSEKYTKAFVKI
jgi:subtilisin family serine protease